jgi:hypothetical protein
MSKKSTTAMMRIAIAGGGGFANILAQRLSDSANAIIVLSRRVRDLMFPFPPARSYFMANFERPIQSSRTMDVKSLLSTTATWTTSNSRFEASI